MAMILKWALFALAVMLVAWIVPDVSVENFQSALLLAFIMGLINLFIKPFLSLITLPINFLTLGLFGLILNSGLFMLAGYFVPGVSINGFIPAFLGSLILGFLGGIIYQAEWKHLP
ncbi:MAG: phage holin family protein [Candidatus Gastranaerophilales bacterium]|nr:phage holin family protein [Candidatus Gastranaerophilales bacterium]